MKGAWKVLKVPFQRAYTVLYFVSGSHRLPCVSIYSYSASNMSVNAVLSIMQCGYPRATHVDLTIGGASLNKTREMSYDLHRPPSKFRLIFG
jgi:hypothetical protein